MFLTENAKQRRRPEVPILGRYGEGEIGVFVAAAEVALPSRYPGK